MADEVLYRSAATYKILEISEENEAALLEWGYNRDGSSMSDGQLVVLDVKNHMVSAILSPEDFAIQFEEIPVAVV